MDQDNNRTLPDGWYYLMEHFKHVPYSAHVAMGTCAIFILIFAVFGNTLVILAFLGFRKLRTPSNMLIVNLALADLLMAVGTFPFLIMSSFRGSWAFSMLTCDYYGAMSTAFGLMSINTLVFISLDRFVVIVSPEYIRRVTYTHALYCVVIIWSYSLLWAAMPLFGWNRYILEGYGTTCTIDYFTRQSPDSHFLLCMFVADYILPICIIVFCYASIFRSVKKHTDRCTPYLEKEKLQTRVSLRKSEDAVEGSLDESEKPDSESGRRRWSQSEYRIARTILTVIFMFCISWTPYSIVVLIGQYSDQSKLSPTVSMLPALFAKLSTVYNPVIYSLSHPRFKKQIRYFFGKNSRDKNRQSPLRVAESMRAGRSRYTKSSAASSSEGEAGYKMKTFRGSPEDE